MHFRYIGIGAFLKVAFYCWLITNDKVLLLWKLDSMIFGYLTNNVGKTNAIYTEIKLKLFTNAQE